MNKLYKFKYLYKEVERENNNRQGGAGDKQNLVYKSPKLEPFFPGVAIEMMGIGKKFKGEVLLSSEELEELLKEELNKSVSGTKKKLKNYICEIEQRIESINSWVKDRKLKKDDYLSELECIEKNINSLAKGERTILFLGGYKGILGSLSTPLDKNKKVKNGFYIDKDSMLPYGLVEINWDI